MWQVLLVDRSGELVRVLADGLSREAAVARAAGYGSSAEGVAVVAQVEACNTNSEDGFSEGMKRVRHVGGACTEWLRSQPADKLPSEPPVLAIDGTTGQVTVLDGFDEDGRLWYVFAIDEDGRGSLLDRNPFDAQELEMLVESLRGLADALVACPTNYPLYDELATWGPEAIGWSKLVLAGLKAIAQNQVGADEAELLDAA